MLLFHGNYTSIGAVSQTINQSQQLCAANDTPIQLTLISH